MYGLLAKTKISEEHDFLDNAYLDVEGTSGNEDGDVGVEHRDARSGAESHADGEVDCVTADEPVPSTAEMSPRQMIKLSRYSGWRKHSSTLVNRVVLSSCQPGWSSWCGCIKAEVEGGYRIEFVAENARFLPALQCAY